MKIVATAMLIGLFILSCNSTKPTTRTVPNDQIPVQDIVRIANDSLEYEILIIEPGFNSWLVSTAKPEGFYSQGYMEARNIRYVMEWNQRVLQPLRYDRNLYEMQIDYQSHIDYGYDVNYKLYNYFIYFQLTYNQRLGPFTPRI